MGAEAAEFISGWFEYDIGLRPVYALVGAGWSE